MAALPDCAASLDEAAQQDAARRSMRGYWTQERLTVLRDFFPMTEYLDDRAAFYAQAHSVTRFLVQQEGGRRRFIRFLENGLASGWTEAARTHYRHDSLGSLQEAWLAWLDGDSPR